MRILVSAILVLSILALESRAQELKGHWEGAVVLRGESWPIEVDFEQNDSDTALLSIRSMGMIGNPTKFQNASTGKSSLSIPFGIGDFELSPVDGLVVSHRKLSNGRRITLLLERVKEYQVPYVQNEVQIPNGETPLRGTTYIPKNAKGPIPGVVILHGSKQSGRSSWEYRSWADYFARRGMATLIYDKRKFEDVYPDLSSLAEDANSAITFFQKLPEIKNDSVGFFGGSQAAWLATSVASQQESNVAFVVMSGWPAVTPGEQEMQSIESNLQTADLTLDELNDALAYLRLYFYVASTSRLSDKLLLAAKSATQTKWGNLVPIPEKPEDLDWWYRNSNFPASQNLAKVKCPILACYGANDSVVPPSRNSERLKKILKGSGNNDVTVAIFQNADHRIEMPMVNNQDSFQWPRLSPEYLKSIESWLAKRGFSD